MNDEKKLFLKALKGKFNEIPNKPTPTFTVSEAGNSPLERENSMNMQKRLKKKGETSHFTIQTLEFHWDSVN